MCSTLNLPIPWVDINNLLHTIVDLCNSFIASSDKYGLIDIASIDFFQESKPHLWQMSPFPHESKTDNNDEQWDKNW